MYKRGHCAEEVPNLVSAPIILTLVKRAQAGHPDQNADLKGRKEDEKREETGVDIPQSQLFSPHTRKNSWLNFSSIPQTPNPHAGGQGGVLNKPPK